MIEEKKLREQAKIYAEQDFLETILFYFSEYRTMVTPNTMANIFIEEFSKVAKQLAKDMNEDEDEYLIPTKKDK